MRSTVEEALFLETLGRQVRSHRHQRGWSQELLAEQAGLSPRFISELENGRGNISVLRLRHVARALGCTIPELLSDTTPSHRIVSLIGLRGAGKSAIGTALGSRLGRDFVELDDRIADAAGLGLEDLFALHGETYYRRLELAVLGRFVSHADDTVLATGGGLVTRPETFELLRRATTTIWLRAAPRDHLERVVAQGDARPMAGRSNPLAELEALLNERTPLYEEADFTVETSGVSVSEATDAIVDYLEAR